MNKKINHPYLFLIIALLLLIKTIAYITHLFGFHAGNIFHSYVASHSKAYEAGQFIGMLTSIILFTGLTIYFFNKFKKSKLNSSV